MGLVAGALYSLMMLGMAFWLACAFFTASVAGSKNLSRFLWFVLAFLFGPLALVAACGMAVRPAR